MNGTGKKLNPLFYEYDISVRAANGLTNAGITTIEQLSNYNISKLLMVKGIGRRTLNELLDLLADLKPRTLETKRKKPRKISTRDLYIYKERVNRLRTYQSISDEVGITRERVRQIVRRVRLIKCATINVTKLPPINQEPLDLEAGE